MGKISKVYYEKIDNGICTIESAAEFYYHSNLIGVHDMFHDEYEKHELSQMNLKNKILGDAIKQNKIEGRPKLDSTVLAISSIQNKVVMIADIY